MQMLLQYAVETMAVTGILYLLYRLLLDRKVPFGWARAYLLGAILLGVVIPALDIPVWTGKVIYVEEVAAVDATGAMVPAPTERIAQMDGLWIIALLYALGAGCFLALILRQCRQIGRIGRHAIRSEQMGYPLMQTEARITPFSFLRTIYIWQQTPAEELPTILAHEVSHIRRGHTIERIAVELLKALLWWNPMVWLVARTLTEVEEFEADQDVLRNGFSRNEYMTTLFRQQFGFSPDISNGLPHSLTKKRFQMMTRNVQHSHALMRGAAVAATVAGLFCAFSLTAQATEYRTSDASVVTEQSADTSKQTVRMIVTNKQGPVVGATIVVVGTTRGTTTDFNGVATIDAAVGDQLQIAYIGHESRTITIGKDTALIVSLTPSEEQPKEDKIYAEKYGDPSIEDTPFLVVEQMPTFNGGDLNTFRHWLMEHIRPCRNEAGEFLTGRVLIQFVIERDGTLTIGRVLQSPDIRLSNEVIRLLASSPRWDPGSQRGQRVRVQYTLPVNFSATEGE